MLALCDRWHKLPSEIYAEPAEDLVRLLVLSSYSRRDDGGETAAGVG